MGLKNISIESKGGRERNGAPLVRVSAPIFSSLFFGFLLDLFRLLKPKGVRGGEKRDNGPKFLVICQAFLSPFETAQFRKGEKGVAHILEKVMRIFFLGGSFYLPACNKIFFCMNNYF